MVCTLSQEASGGFDLPKKERRQGSQFQIDLKNVKKKEIVPVW
jgi:hypothetical protein